MNESSASSAPRLLLGTVGLVEDLDIAVAFVEWHPAKIRDGRVDDVRARNQLGRVGMEGADACADLGAGHIRRRDHEVAGRGLHRQMPARERVLHNPSMPMFLPLDDVQRMVPSMIGPP